MAIKNNYFFMINLHESIGLGQDQNHYPLDQQSGLLLIALWGPAWFGGVVDTQKNCVIDKVLFSTHNIWSGSAIQKGI